MNSYQSLSQTPRLRLAVFIGLSLVISLAVKASQENHSKSTRQNAVEQRNELVDRKDQIDTKAPMPQGDWSFSAHPYFGPDYETRPVIVYSVSSEAAKGLTITKIGIRNTSTKSVAALTLSWRLSKEGDPDSVLLEGRTPLIALQQALPPGQRVFLDFPVVTFAKIIKRLQKGATLVGNFRIEVGASDVLYDDGTISRITNVNSSRIIKPVGSSVVSAVD